MQYSDVCEKDILISKLISDIILYLSVVDPGILRVDDFERLAYFLACSQVARPMIINLENILLRKEYTFF